MPVRPGPPDAGVLFAGGPIRTMAGSARAEALAVRGDRIVAVGGLAHCRDAIGSGSHEVDLAGRCLMPGFVDAHCHPLMLAQTSTWLDASPEAAPTTDALVDLLRARADKMPPGLPLRAYGQRDARGPPHGSTLLLPTIDETGSGPRSGVKSAWKPVWARSTLWKYCRRARGASSVRVHQHKHTGPGRVPVGLGVPAGDSPIRRVG